MEQNDVACIDEMKRLAVDAGYVFELDLNVVSRDRVVTLRHATNRHIEFTSRSYPALLAAVKLLWSTVKK
jgi:hypothetical protein